MSILKEVKNINENHEVYSHYYYFYLGLCLELNMKEQEIIKRTTQRMVFVKYKIRVVDFTWRKVYFDLINAEREELNKMRRIRKQKSILNKLINVSNSQKRVRL